jgi:hypothetical protein
MGISRKIKRSKKTAHAPSFRNDKWTPPPHDPNFKERINAYVCPVGHKTVTVDRAPGVTPMFLTCDTCHQRATSSGYNCDQSLVPKYEWYQATLREYQKAIPIVKDHIRQGGLMFREIKK